MQKYLLFGLQVIAHLSMIPMILFGSWYHWLIVVGVYFITGCFGMTMTYHRLLTHRSYNPPKWFEYFGTLAGSYGLTGSPIAWVAIHREHHRYADTDKDPHSPLNGWVDAQWFSMFHPVNVRYVADLMRDKFQLFVHKNYFIMHIMVIMIWTVIDPMLLVSAYLLPAAILWNMGSFVNTFGHSVGYRSYETKDDSRNNVFLGYLLWGEGWHNNHHAKPMQPDFGRKWWELDIGKFFIKLLDRKNDTD